MPAPPLLTTASPRKLATLALLATTAARAQPPSFTGLGDLPGGEFNSTVHAITPDGFVVVGAGTAPSGWVATRWTASTGLVALGFLGNHTSSRADGVSGTGGVVVGECWGGTGPGTFLWTPTGGMTTPSPPLPSSANIDAISPDAATVVGSWDTAIGVEAYRWRTIDGFLSLGDLPGGHVSASSTAVTPDGSVVVGYSSSAASGAEHEAFRWTAAHGMVALGDLPGGAFRSYAWDVNAGGTVIVGYSSSDLSGILFNEACRWTSAGGIAPLGSLPAQVPTSQALAVSDDGSVIVGWSNTFEGQAAFLWTSSTGMLDLRERLINLGITGLANWRLQSAEAISADGRTIAGNGWNPSGQFEAWIAHLGGAPCYANCDNSTGTPVLTPNDFMCFLMRFVSNDTYANCDAVGGLTASDFVCFQNRYSSGCP